MNDSLAGISSTIRIEASGRAPMVVAIRHFQMGHFILEGSGHNLRHNEEVTADFNFIVDGRVNFLRLTGRVKVDRLYGTRVEFERSSLLKEMAHRLRMAKRYETPCHYLVHEGQSEEGARAMGV